MRRFHVLVVDHDEVFVQSLKAHSSSETDVCILDVLSGNHPLTTMLHVLCPDILLLDGILPGQDVLGLLQSISKMENPPICVLCSQFYSGVMIDTALRCGVALLLCKPIAPKEVFSALREVMYAVHKDISNDAENDNLRQIMKLLCGIGFSPKYIGTEFLRDGLQAAIKNRALLTNLNKGLYIEIATNCHSTPQRVERCIRKAILAASETDSMKAVFPERPSNGTLIRYLFEHIQTNGSAPIRIL